MKNTAQIAEGLYAAVLKDHEIIEEFSFPRHLFTWEIQDEPYVGREVCSYLLIFHPFANADLARIRWKLSGKTDQSYNMMCLVEVDTDFTKYIGSKCKIRLGSAGQKQLDFGHGLKWYYDIKKYYTMDEDTSEPVYAF